MIKRLLKPAFILLAACTVLATSCHKEDKTEKAKLVTLYQSTTKVALDEASSLLTASWEENDALAVNNITRGKLQSYSMTALSTSPTTSFNGRIYCDKDDEISVVFPRSAVDSIKGTKGREYSLDISNQDGTLKSIGKNAWVRFGKATVTSVKDDTGEAYMNGDFATLLGLVKFNFMIGGAKATDITRVCLSDIVTTVTFDNTQNPSSVSLTKSDVKGFIDMKEFGSDNDVFAALFPGKEDAVFYVTSDGNPYEGKASINVEVGKLTTVDVVLSPVSTDDYIEVGSVKWAPANFSYKNGWMFHDNQTDKIDSKSETKDNMDIFNWGLLGSLGRSYGRTIDYYLSIAGKMHIEGTMYTEKTGKDRAYSYNRAKYGDVVYWATKGKYRLPSHSDFYCIAPLATESITAIDGIKSEFTQENGVNGFKFTDESNGNSLFLPAAGYRDIFGERLLENEIGRYFSGNSTSASNATVLFFDKNGAVMTDTHLGDLGHMGYKAFGASIRPVLAL